MWKDVACCLVWLGTPAGVFYLLSRAYEENVEFLKSVTRVDQLKDLANKVLPSIVAISGRVGSDNPITCKHSDLEAVIVEKEATLLFLKKNEAGRWIEHSKVLRSTRKEVPWYLDDGCARVRVVGGYIKLTVRNEVFKKSETSMEDLKILGIKKTEDVLPIGTRLTVVGEAVKNSNGSVRIQRTHGGRFYVSRNTIDELIESNGSWARGCKYVSVGFAAFGFFLITKQAFQYIIKRKRRWEMKKRALDAAAKRTASDIEENGDNGTRTDDKNA